MKTDICPQCGKEFSYYPSSYKSGVKKFCSRDCQKNASRITTTCPECGKEFWYHRSWPRKYCSLKCSVSANRALNLGEYAQGKGPVSTKCDHCGKRIKKSRTDYIKTKHHFCNRSCFGEWLAKTQAGIPRPEVRGERPDLQSRVTLICDQCGKEFMTKASQAERRRFCSKECHNKWMSESGTISGENNFNYKGGYDPYYGPNWRPQRRKARARDNYTCQRCGVTEDELGRQLDVHHIIPFREFGTDRYQEANRLSNLISLCNVCHLITEHESSR